MSHQFTSGCPHICSFSERKRARSHRYMVDTRFRRVVVPVRPSAQLKLSPSSGPELLPARGLPRLSHLLNKHHPIKNELGQVEHTDSVIFPERIEVLNPIIDTLAKETRVPPGAFRTLTGLKQKQRYIFNEIDLAADCNLSSQINVYYSSGRDIKESLP